MGHGNGTIFSPNIDPRGDVAVVLGRTTGDVPLLCSDQEYYDTGDVDGNGNPIYAKRDAGCVKPWPKFKPIRHSCDTILTEAMRQDKYFGFKVDPCGPDGNISTFLANYASQWQYLKPRGIDANPIEYCRILDFDGYDAAANAFVNEFDVTFPMNYYVGRSDQGCTFHFGINAGNNLHAGSISIEDFRLGGSEAGSTPFKDLYMGLLFIRSGENPKLFTGDTLAYAVGSQGTGCAEVFIPEANGSLGGLTNDVAYTVYPVLSLLGTHTSAATSGFTQNDAIIAFPIVTARNPFKAHTTPPPTASMPIFDPATTITANYVRNKIEYYFKVDISGNSVNSMYISYNLYSASSPDDYSGSQLGTSQKVNGDYPVQRGTPFPVSSEIRTVWTDYLRIRIFNRNLPSDYNEVIIAVSENLPE